MRRIDFGLVSKNLTSYDIRRKTIRDKGKEIEEEGKEISGRNLKIYTCTNMTKCN